MILMRILIYGAGVIGEKSMKNEETFKENFQDICFIQKKYIPLQ